MDTIDPGVDIGHVHLKVADLDRSLAFYGDVLGFATTGRMGDQLAFLAAGGYHHHIGLNTLESRGGAPPAPGTTGLYHLALRYPTRHALARALARLDEHGVPVVSARDHGANEAIYVADPDGNGVELSWDRPPEDWPRTPAGDLVASNDPLDLGPLRALAGTEAPAAPRSAGSVVREYLATARAGDWDRAFAFFAEDIAFRVPGRSPFAGEHRGRDAARHYIESAIARAHTGEVELEVTDVLESRDRVALLVHERFALADRTVEIRRANVYRVAGGEIVEVWIYEGDQYEVDALMGSPGLEPGTSRL